MLRMKVDSEKDQDFLEWLIDSSEKSLDLSYLDILTSLMGENGLILDSATNTSFGDYVCSRVMIHCLEKLKKS